MKQFYFAPLEGITTYIYRNLHHQKFGSMDKYFTPFVSPTSNHDFKSRAKKDVIPEHNQEYRLCLRFSVTAVMSLFIQPAV